MRAAKALVCATDDPDNYGRVTVPVSLNGVEKQFLLDTGGFYLQMAPAVAEELKLPLRNSVVNIYAADGSVSKKSTIVEKFGFGSIDAGQVDIPISPNTDADGIFAPTTFRSLDFEMDFTAKQLNILSNDHCDGKVIYWPYKSFAGVPITVQNFQITVPVTLDGHKLTALIDTGASTSTLNLTVARNVLGLTPDSPDVRAVSHLGDEQKAIVYDYPFKTLSLEGVTVTNPQVKILTDVMNKNADRSFVTGSHIQRESDALVLPEIILGMDVLQKLHLYFALKEQKLYLTEASAPVAGPSP